MCTWTLRRSLSGLATGPWSAPVRVPVPRVSPGPGAWEDPFLWVDRRGHFHVLAHIWAHTLWPDNPISGHGFSVDGHAWHFAAAEPYGNAVLRGDGSVQHFATLERPKLVWGDPADPHRPTALLNGASPVWGPNASNPCSGCTNGDGGKQRDDK